VLDDASSGQNPNPISYYLNDDYMRAGDTITGITGVLDQGPINSTVSSVLPYNWYRLQPTAPIAPANITRTNPRTATPPDVGGRLKIIGTNVLNYFPTLDMAPYRTTFPYGGSNTPRGADTAAEFTRQQDKLVAALAAENGDVYTLMEIESWDGAAGGIGAPQALANALNAYLGTPGLYAVVADPLLGYFDPATETDSDFIQVAMLYKTTTVVPVGASISTDDLIFDRSPFAQEFEEIATGEQFVVVANHFKSKGGCPASGADADQGDGQGCWNALRTEPAAALVTWLDSDPTGSRDPDFLWIGDANAFAHEDPIVTIVSGGYTDLISTAAGHAYTVVWDGLSGASDRALASTALVPQVTGVEPWHNNADEPAALDYNEEDKTESQRISLYDTNPYRAASHDPVLVGLRLVPDLSDLEGSYGLAWHTGQGDLRLGTLWGSQGEDGTDSNDGVVLGESSWSDGDGEVSVTVTGASGQYACLHAWLDYTGSEPPEGLVHAPDGLWSPDEEVISGLPLLSGTDQLVTFAIPSGAIDVAAAYNMRFRLVPAPDPSAPACTPPSQLLATDEPLKPTGRADGGEVEDHTFKAGPLAVRIAALDAIPTPGGILITWETVSEHDNAGFNLYRAAASGGPWKKLNETLIPAASPGSSEGHAYRWLDSSADPVMMHYYLLEDVALDGSRTRHTPVEVIPARPNAVRLSTLSGTSILPLVLTALVILSILGGLPPALWAIHDRRMHGHRHPGRDAVEGREHLAARLRKMPHR